jgi:hypothetical protein
LQAKAHEFAFQLPAPGNRPDGAAKARRAQNAPAWLLEACVALDEFRSRVPFAIERTSE